MTGNPDSGNWSYSYDEANRMISATDPGAVTTTYGYDGAGNRISVQEGTQAPELTSYTADGLPDTVVKNSTTIETYTHDGAGNLTSINDQVGSEDRSFAYDAYSRTTAFCPQETYSSSCSDHVSFGIDALSRTISRTEGAVSTEFSYRGKSEDIVAQGSTLIAQGPFGPLAQGSAGSASFYLKDLHSDVVGLYGASSGTKLYDPWGESRASTGATTELGFQSDYTDPDSGQVDMGTRYYEPTMGRFSTQDVLFGEATNPNTLNQYVYGGDSPVTMWDPTGMTYCHGSGGEHCGPNVVRPGPDPCHQQGTCAGGGVNNNGNGTTGGDGAAGPSPATERPKPTPLRDYESRMAQLAAEREYWHLQHLDAIRTLEVMDAWTLAGGTLVGLDDGVACSEGSISGCFWTAVSLIPGGRLTRAGKVLDAADDIRDIGRAVGAVDDVGDAMRVARAAGKAGEDASSLIARYGKN